MRLGDFLGDPPKPLDGLYLTAQQIVDVFFAGTGITHQWVKRNVPGKVRLGHRTVAWRRAAVLEWLLKREEGKGSPPRG